MIRWRNIRIICLFEFLSTVKRKSYLIATFGMPLFILGYAGVISTIQYVMERKDAEPRVYGIVDGAGVVGLKSDLSVPDLQVPEEIRATLPAGDRGILETGLALVGSSIFRSFDSKEDANRATVEKKIRGYFVFAGDYLESGTLDEFMLDRPGLDTSNPRRALRSLLQERLLSGRVENSLAERVRDPVAGVRSWTIDADGQIQDQAAGTALARIIVPLAFTFLLFTALMMSAGYLVQGTAVEKENKVVEVLLSSARPEEVLAGKLIGLGSAGLLQVTVWFGMILFAGVAFAAVLSAYGVAVPWAALGIGLIFFTVGYLFLGSLMLGFGSLGSTQRESQQLGAIWSLLAVVPMMFIGILLQEPHGIVGQVMTWIPFTAPVTVVFRLAMDPAGIRWWEITGSLVLLLLSVWVALGIGARLFRIGLVLTGARPKLREILRQARLG